MTEVEINKQNLTKLIKNKQSFIFVSKYWDKETTGKLQRQIINYLGKENANLFFGLGENRIENLIKKILLVKNVILLAICKVVILYKL